MDHSPYQSSPRCREVCPLYLNPRVHERETRRDIDDSQLRVPGRGTNSAARQEPLSRLDAEAKPVPHKHLMEPRMI